MKNNLHEKIFPMENRVSLSLLVSRIISFLVLSIPLRHHILLKGTVAVGSSSNTGVSVPVAAPINTGISGMVCHGFTLDVSS